MKQLKAPEGATPLIDDDPPLPDQSAKAKNAPSGQRKHRTEAANDEGAKDQASKPSGLMKSKSYTLPPSDIDYIAKIGFKESAEQGKLVTASEVLRMIIDQHRKAQS